MTYLVVVQRGVAGKVVEEEKEREEKEREEKERTRRAVLFLDLASSDKLN